MRSLKNDGIKTDYDRLVLAPAGAVAFTRRAQPFGMPGEQPFAII